MSDLILTLAEVSDRTRVPVATLRYYRHLGDQGPRSFRVGGRVVYKSSDVDAWIEEQYATTASGESA